MSTLTDRYVHATTRFLGESRRHDISRELTASIDDMVAARVEAGEPVDVAERAVLTELGDPVALAVQYSGRATHLIGPRHFPTFLRVLVLALLWIPGLVGAISVIERLASDASVGSAIGHGVVTALSVAVHVAFWTVAVFAVLEWTGADRHLPAWSVDQLPEVPRAQQVSLADTIASLFLIGLVAAVLVVQSFRSWIPGPDGSDVPVLDLDLWSSWLPFLLGVLVVCLVIEFWKYSVGRYTWPVVGAVVATSLAWVVPVAWLAAQDRLLSRDFVAALDLSGSTLDRVNLFIVIGAVLIELGTIVDAVVKAVRAPRLEVRSGAAAAAQR